MGEGESIAHDTQSKSYRSRILRPRPRHLQRVVLNILRGPVWNVDTVRSLGVEGVSV